MYNTCKQRVVCFTCLLRVLPDSFHINSRICMFADHNSYVNHADYNPTELCMGLAFFFLYPEGRHQREHSQVRCEPCQGGVSSILDLGSWILDPGSPGVVMGSVSPYPGCHTYLGPHIQSPISEIWDPTSGSSKWKSNLSNIYGFMNRHIYM